MLVSEKILKKLANGSDVRGVAVEGVPDEPVTVIISQHGWVRTRQGHGIDPSTQTSNFVVASINS